MKRNLSITIDKTDSNPSNIFINDINNIVNHSCDSISFSYLEYIQEKDHIPLMSILLDKIRPLGKLIIRIGNVREITRNFISSSVSNEKFLEFFKNKQSIITTDALYSLIDFNKFNISDLQMNETTINIVLERISL